MLHQLSLRIQDDIASFTLVLALINEINDVWLFKRRGSREAASLTLTLAEWDIAYTGGGSL